MNLQPAHLLRTFFTLPLAATAVAQSDPGVVISAGDQVPGLPGVTVNATSSFDLPVMDQNGTILVRARMTGAVTGADDRAYLLGRDRGDLRVAIRAGDQAPGLPAGVLLRNSSGTAGSVGLSSAPRISPYGEILLFQSSLYNPFSPASTPPTADTALFWGPVGNMVCLAREGDLIPFLSSETWGNLTASLQTTQINASGQVAFLATAVGGSAATDGLLVTGTPGALMLVVRRGDVMSGGEVVSHIAFSPLINESGQVLHDIRFATNAPSTATAANDQALAIWTPGNGNTILAREGQAAPGLPGVQFGTPTGQWSVNQAGANFSRSGETVFATKLIGQGVMQGVNDEAIYHGGLGGLNLVMRRGDACPGLASGELFDAVYSLSVTCNNLGDVAFTCKLSGPSVDTTNDTSLWVRKNGQFSLLAREGDAVPSNAMPPSASGPLVYGDLAQGGFAHAGDGGVATLHMVSYVDDFWERIEWKWARLERRWLDGVDIGPYPGDLSICKGSGDGTGSQSTNDGDVIARGLSSTGLPSILRGHVGSLQATPASIPAAGGVAHSFTIDCGPAEAFRLYVVIAGGSGTRPGFQSPFGPQTIRLNPDGWIDTSLALANSAVYQNSIGILDAQGRASASLNLPSGLSGLAGTSLNHVVLVLDIMSLQTTFVSEPSSLLIY